VRKRSVGVGAVAIAFGLIASYFVLAFRTCGEVTDVPRGSFDYRLGGSLIARIPVVAPGNEPLYSSTPADGLALGHDELRYQSLAPPSQVRTTLAEYLRQTGFSEKPTDDDYEWWTDHHTELGLSIRAAQGGSRVEIVHNTGND
jgi:hypothetical protein